MRIARVTSVLSLLLFGAALHAQPISFDVDPQVSAGQYWNNVSDNGAKCNIGYVLAGIAGSSGAACSNVHPADWLPYKGPSPDSFFDNPDGSNGPYGFEYGVGTFAFRWLGDIAPSHPEFGWYGGSDPQFDNPDPNGTPTPLHFWSWGVLSDLKSGEERTVTITNPAADFDTWGFWVKLGDGTTAYSFWNYHLPQFALFMMHDQTDVVSFEAVNTLSGLSDRDYSDAILSVRWVSEVPEPSAALFLAAGLAGLYLVARRRRVS